MFAPVQTTANLPVAIPAPASTTVAKEQLQPATPDIVVPDLNGANAGNIKDSASIAPTPQKQKAKKNSSPTNSKQDKKSTTIKKPSQQAATWQQYVKDEFKDATLSVAVAEVMQQQSEQVLEIAKIIDAIFTNNIPKEVKSTARERVSNVLSIGAKNGKWYRGKLGKYSMSKVAIDDT